MMTSVTASLEEKKRKVKSLYLNISSFNLQDKLNILSICSACQMAVDFLSKKKRNV
jgi:hypothetical protein